MRILFATKTSLGPDWQLLILLTYHFQYRKVGFYYLIHYWMQVVDSKFVGYWKHQYWASLSWESMEFSAFLILAVWTASITYLTSGKGELQTTDYFLSLYSYFRACYLISHPSLLSIYFFYIYIYIYIFYFLFIYFFFAGSQQLMHWAHNISLWQS